MPEPIWLRARLMADLVAAFDALDEIRLDAGPRLAAQAALAARVAALLDPGAAALDPGASARSYWLGVARRRRAEYQQHTTTSPTQDPTA